MARTSDPRRFGGIARLYGLPAAQAIGHAHVCLVGCGGVGSWCGEALARSGVGRLTVIDGDRVEESNVNRQLPAMSSTIGRPKAEVLAERFRDIHPEGVFTAVTEFITAGNPLALVPEDACVVIDAIDSMDAKTALLACLRESGRVVLTAGGMGGKTDALRIRRGDLARAGGDALLSRVRTRLRKDYGFPAGAAHPSKTPVFGIPCVYSDEPVRPCAADAGLADVRGAGFGTSACVTAAAGLMLGALALDRILMLAGFPEDAPGRLV